MDKCVPKACVEWARLLLARGQGSKDQRRRDRLSYTSTPACLMLTSSQQIKCLKDHSDNWKWETMNQPPCAVQWLSLSNGKIWALGTDGTLNGTDNAGGAWTSLSVKGALPSKIDVSFDNSRIWCVDRGGKLYVGEFEGDRLYPGDGVKFTPLDVAGLAPGSAAQVSCAENRVAVLAKGGKHMFVSADNGASWSQLASPLPTAVVLDIHMRATGQLWCCTDEFSTWAVEQGSKKTKGDHLYCRRIFEGTPGSGAVSLALPINKDHAYIVCPVGKVWQMTLQAGSEGETYMEAYGDGRCKPTGIPKGEGVKVVTL